MKSGWGYGRSSQTIGERLYNNSIKMLDNNVITVYVNRVSFFGCIEIKIIISKTDNIKRVKMRYEGDNTICKIYDVSQCKSKKEVCAYINDVLLDKYYFEAYGVKAV